MAAVDSTELSSTVYTAGVPLADYNLDDEVMTLIHLLRVQAVPMSDGAKSWHWEVRSCHSSWCVNIPSGASTADWKEILGKLIEARRT